jgi:hypothetical protein
VHACVQPVLHRGLGGVPMYEINALPTYLVPSAESKGSLATAF